MRLCRMGTRLPRPRVLGSDLIALDTAEKRIHRVDRKRCRNGRRRESSEQERPHAMQLAHALLDLLLKDMTSRAWRLTLDGPPPSARLAHPPGAQRGT